MSVKPAVRITAREAALKALAAYRREKARPERTLARIIEQSHMSAREAALASRLLGGVLQNMMLCDYYIDKFSTVKKIEPQVLDILRLSIYQLMFLTRIPASAAVSEGVKLVSKYPRAKGFVNAVLRKAAAALESGSLPEISGETEFERMAVRYSHPEWLVRELAEIHGVSGTEELLKANNAEESPAAAQVNVLLTDTETLLQTLSADGVQAARHKRLENCVLLRGAGNIERLEAFKKGFFYIQDEAAKLAVTASGVRPGMFVIDGCAAPGGKSFAAAIAMENKGRLLSADLHGQKLRHIESGAKRLGIGIIETREQNAAEFCRELTGTADVVIADVPCSGFGVIRKKPEIRYKPESEIAGLPDIQLEILSNLSAYVKPDGVLIYSTCTILKNENEGVAEAFLARNNNFTAESFSLPEIGEVPDGMITLLPHLHGTDGFFICKMRRRV